MTLASGTEHLRGGPSWNCRTCARPWPCTKARADLTEEFRDFPSVLTVYMAAQMHDALTDMTVGNRPAPRDLYERFLAWIQHSLPEPMTGSRRSPIPQSEAPAAAKTSGPARYGNRTTIGKPALAK